MRPDGTPGLCHWEAGQTDTPRCARPDSRHQLATEPLPRCPQGTPLCPQHRIHRWWPPRHEPNVRRRGEGRAVAGPRGASLEGHPRRGARHYGRAYRRRRVPAHLDGQPNFDPDADSLRGSRYRHRLDRQLGDAVPLRLRHTNARSSPQSRCQTSAPSPLAACPLPRFRGRVVRHQLPFPHPRSAQRHATRSGRGCGHHARTRPARHRGTHGTRQDRGRPHVRTGARRTVRARRHLLRSTDDGHVQSHVRSSSGMAGRCASQGPVKHFPGSLESWTQRGVPAAHAVERHHGRLRRRCRHAA